MKSQSEKNYLRERIEFERGMIEGWKHVKNLCSHCIKAHRQEIKDIKKRHAKKVNQ